MKTKKIISIVLILALVFTLVACGDSSSVTDEGNIESNEQPQTTSLEDKVVIYSTHGESMLELVATEFEEETGVKVEFINLKGELAERVRAEKENPQSDVMYGGSSSIFMDLASEDLFAEYEPSWGSELDPLFKDEAGFWYGTIQTPVMMFYNSDMLSQEDAPKDWSDLGNDEYEGQLVFRNALSSSARATYASLLQQSEKAGNIADGWSMLQEIDANTKSYYNSGSLMFQAIGRQEASISFATLNSIIDNKINNNIPLEVIDAESGSPIITDGIALINNAAHPNAAKAFIDFAGSPEIQALLANEFNRLPTSPAALADSPEWMSEITYKAMEVDWADLSSKEGEWMQQWDTEIKDANKDIQK